jgi:hypothetical protein
MINTDKINKLKVDIESICSFTDSVVQFNEGCDKTVLVRLMPKHPDEDHIMNDHFEDMIVESLLHKGYDAENIPGIGFIVKDMD